MWDFSGAMQRNPQAILGLASGLLSDPRNSRAALGAGFRGAMLGAQTDTLNQRNQLADQRAQSLFDMRRSEFDYQQQQRARQDASRKAMMGAVGGMEGLPDWMQSVGSTTPEVARSVFSAAVDQHFNPPKPVHSPYQTEMLKQQAKADAGDVQSRVEAKKRAGILRRGLAQFQALGQTVENPDHLVGIEQRGIGRFSDSVFGGTNASARSRLRSVANRLKVELSSALQGQGQITEAEREMIANTVAEIEGAHDWQTMVAAVNDGIQFYESIASGQPISAPQQDEFADVGVIGEVK